MAKKLTRLRIDEVSSVDRGAGEGVKILLMKRGETAKDKPMGTNLVNIFSRLFSGSGGGNNTVIIDKALEGLAESVGTIVTDAANPEELSTGLANTFGQFGDHLKKTLAAGTAVAKKEGQEMDLAVLKKALGLADTATEADVTNEIAKNVASTTTLAADMKKMNHELAMSKADFTAAELAFSKASYDAEEDDEMGDGDPKGNGKPSRKKDFRLASHAERNAIMKAAEPPLPAHIQKIMLDNVAMAKRVAELEAGGNLVEMTKKAVELGLPETEAATLAKAYAGDKEAIEKLMTVTKSALAAARAGGVFKEFGTSGGTGVAETAVDQLNALAKDLQKRETALSFPQAFTKVYEDPSNSEIVKRERAENRPSAA